MRCYTDIEVRAITEHRVLYGRLEASLHSKESVIVLPVHDAMNELFPALHTAMPEMVQFIADLEFETNFTALLHSIALRYPALCWPAF